MTRTIVTIAAVGVAATVLAGSAIGPAQAADATRGRLLYESRCVDCHATSVHRREARTAKDFAGVLAQVERWDRNLGGAWTRSELEDVARYLNERYYKYDCPQTICASAGQVMLGR